MTSNKWQKAILDQLAIAEIEDDCDLRSPAKVLQELIDWHVMRALDPAISERAQALVDRGMRYQCQSWKGLTEKTKMELWESYRDPACTAAREGIMDDVEQLLKERNT